MPIDQSRPPAVALLRKLGMEPDPWQVEVLDGDQPRLPLNCSACPNLLAEACLYRYPENGAGGSENPLDEHNHALAALRYLISRLDERRMARHSPPTHFSEMAEEEPCEAPRIVEEKNFRERQREHLWTHPGAWTVLG